ncbi:MAG: enoyl-CoA hydratase/isomerase family protein [Gammaproteobacteria bacterium]|nr:enoyl-CoA hydratase/isomerase family protein [Gammaproteobacteria bacterium]
MKDLVNINYSKSIVEIQMDRRPVNALNQDLVVSIHNAIDVSIEEGAKGLILSGHEGIFSAGLDVKTLITLSKPEISEFFHLFWGLMGKISKSPIPIVAAITGHSPAGGAVLTTFCDYRVAAKGDYKIGMNEVFVGLTVPKMIFKAFARLVGENHANILMMQGKLMKFEFAYEIGFINELVDMDQVVPRSIEWLEHLVSLPAIAMNSTRMNAKSDLNDLIDKELIMMGNKFSDNWFSDEVQIRMKEIVKSL